MGHYVVNTFMRIQIDMKGFFVVYRNMLFICTHKVQLMYILYHPMLTWQVNCNPQHENFNLLVPIKFLRLFLYSNSKWKLKNLLVQTQVLLVQSLTLAVVRWPTACENWFGPVTFAKFFQQNLYKYSNFEVFWPVNSKV